MGGTLKRTLKELLTQQVLQYPFYRRENQLCIRQNFCFREKISRMPSAEMEDFVEHTPRKALKILRRL